MKWRVIGVVTLALWACNAALAQSGDAARYPTRPVRIVVPFGAGGPSDLLARTVAQKMSESLGAVGIKDKGFIIDTARNGKGGIRTRWGNWCNIKGAGLGERPRAAPAPLVHAYFWVKPPGESDGSCNGGPKAGNWWPEKALEMAKNAKW